ncbi:TPA: hypothetical protein ACVBYD_000802 [Yersinia enterocolitica]|uniref:hypothetical protein n=1 Tax=Yersinia enterocolitica TaxID=630 RepID=UPI0028B693B9|nr:hypothetical protein [Yersinia enterocolitica]ELI8407874.1 hypothetical protein [Yersinia enterocolitica]ELW8974567.1 hypothetical protein [Yersinia enterocolitica]HDL6629412.1 hypothetical protein [Yersinia enterocolitica]HDL6656363.1 hypothetical protein [Yersinia enterocolitica]
MSYGMQILRDDGYLWLSPDITPLNLIQKIRITTNNTYQTNVPSNKTCLGFYRTDSNTTFEIKYSNSGANWSFTAAKGMGSGWVYIFSNIALVSSGYGIKLFNELGELTYSTDSIPLMINKYPVVNIGDATSITDIGKQVAVMPGLVATRLTALNPALGIYLFGYNWSLAFGTSIGHQNTFSEQIEGQRPTFKFKQYIYYIDCSIYD